MNAEIKALFAVIALLTFLGCGGGVAPEPTENREPYWDGEVGIQSAVADDESINVTFGTASDPDNDQVYYYLYYVNKTLTSSDNPFGSNGKKKMMGASPYRLTGVENKNTYWLSVRAQDSRGKDDGNCKKVEATPMSKPDLNMAILKAKLSAEKTVCYAPTHFNPDIGQYPPESEIRLDLQTLYNAGFRGVVTYSSENTLACVPRVAKEVGFRLVIMGVWSPINTIEMQRAVNAVTNVDAYCVGNEGLTEGRYQIDSLIAAFNYIHDTTQKPVTTTETWDNYSATIVNLVDWVFPNAHPYWHNIKEPSAAADWLEARFNSFDPKGKYLCFKETGLPTAGDTDLSEDNQKLFYELLESKEVCFCYFEAFDQPWKTWATVEPHWGLFENDRSPKKIVEP